ncbi:uncharacterized protein BKCO1_2300043 [Diplodia corticola]|uniref:Uncharacterized protein n=1 Tax=Diplodia corticola TaxID=236234 RepID=A0A1J9RPF4_9PEZI|nr:uncharacterized protein BKCO1_2300043 [Diplodia corticola]OJD34435.1 hypothetical protein BKCO1_2300043 [Diplodia corticola]
MTRDPTTPGSYKSFKMPMLAYLPRIDEVRRSARMPLDCARDIIYATAKEIQQLKRSASYFSDLDTISFDDGAPELAGLHDHLFRLALKNVINVEVGPDGTTEVSINELLYNYEDLWYITVYHIVMLYRELYRDFSAGRLAPYSQFAEHLPFQTVVEHLYQHWAALADPILMATLDFSIRKENLMRFKTVHNLKVFVKSGTYIHNRDLVAVASSIRKGLNAIPFDETQLDTDKYPGLTPELDKPDFASALLHHLRHANASCLAVWLYEHNISPSYSVFDDKQQANEADFLEYVAKQEQTKAAEKKNNKKQQQQQQQPQQSPSTIAAPDIFIPIENAPRTIDFNKVCNYLPYIDADDLTDIDDDEMDLQSELADEMDEHPDDPFSEAVRCPAASPSINPTINPTTGTGNGTSKKRARAPSPIDTALANGTNNNNNNNNNNPNPNPINPAKRLRPLPSPPTPSPLTLGSFSPHTGTRGKPRRCMSVLPSPVPPRTGEPLLTHLAETAAQHAHDTALEGKRMAAERARALRALCGEETAADDARREREAEAEVGPEVVAAWWADFGPHVYWVRE